MERNYLNNSLGRSHFSPKVRPSLGGKSLSVGSFLKSPRYSISAKSTQSLQIILSTSFNFVERFGQPIPVLITEALTFADRNTIVSASISNNGYAWVVCGRRLLIWQYRQSTQPLIQGTPQKKSNLINQCFELQLSQSDLAHRAELVNVIVNKSSATPSCISVSPEGVVRYWPAIIHEGVSIEQSINLHGQECDSLTDIEGFGCILATTTCTIMVIQPYLHNGRPALKCKPLKMPSGWLGGISRRMSSLIFGSISTEHLAETRLVRVLTVPNGPDMWHVYVLAGHTLQKWLLTNQNNEELIFVCELNRLIIENFRTVLWDNCINNDQGDIDTWILDLQYDENSLILLAAGVNLSISPRVHYSLISIQTNTLQAPTHIKDFLLLKMSNLYRENDSDGDDGNTNHSDTNSDFLSYRFLLCGTCAYLYNKRCINIIKPQEEPDILDFHQSTNDTLLAGAICINTPIFFLKNNGLVSVSSNEISNSDFNLNTSNNAPIESSIINGSVINNLSIYNMDPDKMMDAYKDTVSQLKAAFVFHVKKDENAYRELINEIFPNDTTSLPGIDLLLDKVVGVICTDLLDDIPARDPRWNKDIPLGLGSSYTMQILHQLEDKQRAHLLFVQFLKDSGLWNRLGVSTIRNNLMATIYYLSEQSEKIVAALTLKRLPMTKILEKAIQNVIKESDVPLINLTPQDIFYRKVSKIHRGIHELVNYCEDVLHSDMEMSEILEILKDTNEIVLAVLKEVIQHRYQNMDLYCIPENIKKIAPDYLLWTSANGNDGLLDCLMQLHYFTYSSGIKLSNNDFQRNLMVDYLVQIIDIILDGKKCYIESLKNTARAEVIYKQYCLDRKKLMKPLIQEKEWELAIQLSEKYLDFELLIEICDLTNNQSRLDDYIERFNNDGFSDYVYNWYLKENKQAKLINNFRKIISNKNNMKNFNNLQKLTTFLSEHPSLAWIQNIFDKNYDLAANILKELAIEECELINRQKTMFSLAKLCKMASDNDNNNNSFIKNINYQLELITFQESIPEYLLELFGYDTKNQRVIPAKDQICLFISEQYNEATELDFKKALDLLIYIYDDDLKQKLLLKIWCSAILRDTWDYDNLDEPLEVIKNKLFFKLIYLIFNIDRNNLNYLPSVEILLNNDLLKGLQNNNNFQFLIKTGIEEIYRRNQMEIQ